MIEQWLLNVNNCEQRLLTTVVDRMQHNIVEQYAAQNGKQVVDNIDQVVHFCACMCWPWVWYQKRAISSFAHSRTA